MVLSIWMFNFLAVSTNSFSPISEISKILNNDKLTLNEYKTEITTKYYTASKNRNFL